MNRGRQLFRQVLLSAIFILLSGSITGEQSSAPGVIDPPRPVFSFRAELPGGTFLANSDRWLEDVKAAVGETAEMVDSVLGEFELSGYELIVADRESLFDSLVGDAFPDWGGAVAIPALNRIVLKSPMISSTDKPFSSLVAHEYAHLAIHAALAGRAAPRWLDEGLATYLAGEWSYRDFFAITIASWRGRFVPLARIRRLNTFDEKTARLAYAESYLAIKHLIDYYGVESVRALIASLRDGLTVDDALRETIGANLDGFQTELIAEIKKRHSPLGIVMESTIFWGALALVAILGFILARVRRKARYSEWERRENYESTDFDYGDPERPERIEDEDEPWK